MKTTASRTPGPCICRLACLFILTAFNLPAANWPEWRGPHGDGRCDEKKLPMHWTTNENIRWRISLPDRGNSTPVIWGGRIFVTQ
ncbi:MAG: hypothetical protein QOF48_2171, partial [Verrucomicrobiota bacterium]